MGRLQCNFTENVILLYWKCVQQNIADSFYCNQGTIAISLSSNIVWADYNLVYLIDTVIWHGVKRLKYFIQGNWQMMRVLLYTFCTGYHFKQIKHWKALAMSLISEENHCVSMHDLYSDQSLNYFNRFQGEGCEEVCQIKLLEEKKYLTFFLNYYAKKKKNLNCYFLKVVSVCVFVCVGLYQPFLHTNYFTNSNYHC